MCQQEYRWLRENVGYKYLVPFVNAQKKIEHFLSSRNLKRHVFQLLAFSKILFWVNMALRFIHLVLSALVRFKLEALTVLKDIYRTFVLSVSKLVTNSLHIFFCRPNDSKGYRRCPHSAQRFWKWVVRDSHIPFKFFSLNQWLNIIHTFSILKNILWYFLLLRSYVAPTQWLVKKGKKKKTTTNKQKKKKKKKDKQMYVRIVPVVYIVEDTSWISTRDALVLDPWRVGTFPMDLVV